MKVVGSVFLLIISLFVPVTAIAADSTSYAPPGIVQNQHQNMHGHQITDVGQLRLRAGNAIQFEGTNTYIYGDGANLAVRQPGAFHVHDISGTTRPLFAERLLDGNNSGYYVDPSYVSRLNDIRPSIMYDGDHTGYYVDPNATSNLGTVYTQGAIVSPIVYDINNTGYYVDPNATSNVNRLLVNYNGGMPTYAYDVATKQYVDSKAGGGGAWSTLVETSAESFTWTNTYGVQVFVSGWGGNDGGKNGCHLAFFINGLQVYSNSDANTSYSKDCGGTTIVPAGATLGITSTPYAGSGYIRAYKYH